MMNPFEEEIRATIGNLVVENLKLRAELRVMRQMLGEAQERERAAKTADPAPARTEAAA